jgi:hypothetical protein
MEGDTTFRWNSIFRSNFKNSANAIKFYVPKLVKLMFNIFKSVRSIFEWLYLRMPIPWNWYRDTKIMRRFFVEQMSPVHKICCLLISISKKIKKKSLNCTLYINSKYFLVNNFSRSNFAAHSLLKKIKLYMKISFCCKNGN